MINKIEEELRGIPGVDLLELTKQLYSNVRTQISNGSIRDQETIRAANEARMEIERHTGA